MDFRLPFELGNFPGDTGIVIYDPNINERLGQRGIETIKDGSFMDVMPRDARVLISTVQEPICVPSPYHWHENQDIVGMIAQGCQRNGLDPGSFAYASGDRRVSDFNDTGIASFFVPGWNHHFWQYERVVRDIDTLSDRSCDHAFLSFNRIVRPHRWYFMCRLWQEDLLRSNLVSCPDRIFDRTFHDRGCELQHQMLEQSTQHDPYGTIDWERMLATSEELQKHLPLVLDVSDFAGNGCFEIDTLISSTGFYQRSFMSVVTESSAHGPGLYPSEAIFRPIIFQHPFMTVAQPGMLSLLREWGFDTFDDLFDNSYDDEPCQYARTEMVVANIKRIAAMAPADLCGITRSIAHRLRDNRERYFSQAFRDLTREYVVQVYNWLHEKR